MNNLKITQLMFSSIITIVIESTYIIYIMIDDHTLHPLSTIFFKNKNNKIKPKIKPKLNQKMKEKKKDEIKSSTTKQQQTRP